MHPSLWILVGLALGVVLGAILFRTWKLDFYEFAKIRYDGYNAGVESAASLLEKCSFCKEEDEYLSKKAELIRGLKNEKIGKPENPRRQVDGR